MTRRHTSAWNHTAAQEAHTLGRWFAAARREGLLARLTPEAWQTLSALLSFTGRDGRRLFSLDQLAAALGQPREAAQSRLEQLLQTEWKGQPLVQLEVSPAGEPAGAVLAPLELLDRVEPAEFPPARATGSATDSRTAATAVTAAAGLAAELEAVGLLPVQSDRLLQEFGPERVRRQLQWLPARGARNPAALLIRSVEEDWEKPRGVV